MTAAAPDERPAAPSQPDAGRTPNGPSRPAAGRAPTGPSQPAAGRAPNGPSRADAGRAPGRPKPARIPLGAEPGRGQSSGLAALGEGLGQPARRGLQGRPAVPPSEGLE